MNASPKPEQLRTVIPTEQIQKRLREMARQISSDYQGKTIHALGLLENGFVFVRDLDSTNGTFINEGTTTIAREEIKDNDLIRLGKLSLKFKCL